MVSHRHVDVRDLHSLTFQRENMGMLQNTQLYGSLHHLSARLPCWAVINHLRLLCILLHTAQQ